MSMYTQSHYKKYKSISFGDTDSSRPNYFARSWSNNNFKQKVVIKQWKTIINIGALRACFVVCFYVVSLCLLNVYLEVLKKLWEKKKIVLKLVLLRSRAAALFFFIYLKYRYQKTTINPHVKLIWYCVRVPFHVQPKVEKFKKFPGKMIRVLHTGGLFLLAWNRSLTQLT